VVALGEDLTKFGETFSELPSVPGVASKLGKGGKGLGGRKLLGGPG